MGPSVFGVESIASGLEGFPDPLLNRCESIPQKYVFRQYAGLELRIANRLSRDFDKRLPPKLRSHRKEEGGWSVSSLSFVI